MVVEMMLEEGRPYGPRQLKPPWLVVDTKDGGGGGGGGVEDCFHSPLQRGLTLTLN